MYNSIGYGDNRSKKYWILWQYHRDEPFIDNNSVIIDVPDDSESALLKFKQKITGQTENEGTKDFQIIVPLKY